MSYILDALKKAAHEHRSEEQSLDLHIPYQSDTTAEPQHLRLWGIIITINILLVILVLWQQFTPPLPTPQPVSSIQPPIQSIEKIEKSTPQASPIVVIETPPPQPLNPTPTHIKKLIAQLGDNTVIKEEKAIVSPAIVEKTIEMEKKTTLPKKIPLLNELSAQFQASVPSLEINAHVYSEQANKRFVLINGRRYSENSYIHSNLQLQAIQPNDIVLEYKKQLFRLRIGN